MKAAAHTVFPHAICAEPEVNSRLNWFMNVAINAPLMTKSGNHLCSSLNFEPWNFRFAEYNIPEGESYVIC